MEISVEGKSSLSITPDLVIIDFNFVTKADSYEEVLNIGIKNIESFNQELLSKYKFNKDDLKTRNFIIKEETKYNEKTHQYEFDGYSYNQTAILKFDYNQEKLANIMIDISKLSNPPFYQINFGLKNEEKQRKIVLAEAYNDAFKKAEIIATADGSKLKKCLKVDFKPLTDNYISQTTIPKMLSMENSNFTNVFTPLDIEINEVIYCLWLAEK